MANSLAGRSQSIAGLGTFSHTVVNAGEWTFQVNSTLPLGSGLQIQIQKNGSNLITAVGGAATNPTPTQLSLGAGTSTYANAGDVLSVIFSSSNNVDSQPNAVKSTVTLYPGK